ncbi:MAG: MFS transporter [Christensenellaceae bacterium]|jgi:PPP family 3-phenylpropionic acid transporter|nr:MFS transporter [Christensenellaceae bacterium]
MSESTLPVSEKAQNHITLAMVSLYFIVWGSQFLGNSFLPIYISSLPFATSATIGLATALGALITALMQPIWGIIADHARTKNFILMVALLGVAATVWLFILPRHNSLTTLLLSIAALYLFLLAPQALTDTIVVENMPRVRLRFGAIKCFSSGGAAGMAIVVSFIQDIDTNTAFMLMSAVALLALLPLFFMPPTKGHAHGGGAAKKIGLREVLQNKRLLLLLAFGVCHFSSVSCLNTFLGVYFATSAGLNAGIGMFSLLSAISITLEAALMLVGSKFINRLNVYTVFLLAPLAGVGRSLIIFLAPNAFVMMTSAIFHALMFGPLWVRMAPYIRSIVPGEMRATGQGLWSIMSAGIGPIFGSLLGGLLSGALGGLRNVFLVTSCLLALVAVVFFFLFRRQRATDEAEGFSIREG